jgi:hypothetical protein
MVNLVVRRLEANHTVWLSDSGSLLKAAGNQCRLITINVDESYTSQVCSSYGTRNMHNIEIDNSKLHSIVKCENCPRLWQRDVNAVPKYSFNINAGYSPNRTSGSVYKGLCCFYHPRSSLYEPFSSQCPTSTILILKISDV